MRLRAAPLESTSILETGEFTAVIATERRDAYGDELVVDGADIADFEANPVLFDQHDRATPIGRAVSIERTADQILARFRLLSAGVSAAADRVREMIAQGVLNAVSVGFLPLDSLPIPGAGQRHTRWRLAEVSVVALPANPDAVIVARSAPEVPAMSEAVTAPAAAPAAAPVTVPIAAAPIAAPAAPSTVPVATPTPRTLGAQVAASDLLTRAAHSGQVRDEFKLSLRALGGPGIGGAGNTAVSTPPAYIGPFANYGAPARLIDVLQVIPVTGGTVMYDVLTPTGNAAAPVSEANAKPAQPFTVQAVTAEVPTVAVTVKVTKQLLADLPAVTQLLDQTLSGLVLDKADADAFAKLTTAGAFTPWAGAVLGENTFDGIARVVSALQTAGAKQIVVAINPADALAMQLAKADSSGVYLVPPSLNAQVIAVPVVPAGQVLGFDVSAVALALREQVAVEIGLDADDWSKNLRTLLCETRQLAVSRKPAQVLYGPLTTSTGAEAARKR
jgi:HK97 family phage prohead protease